MKKKISSALQKLHKSRDPKRMRARRLLELITDDGQEICGDRLHGDDRAVICMFAYIQGKKILFVAQDKGSDRDSRLATNFGMMHPEGFRKALRAMKLAEKFQIPIVTIIDTPGAHPGIEAENRGQGFAIARNLLEMSRLKTPILSIILSEGCSGGALGLCVSDRVAMLENSYFSVILPEGFASILFKDNSLLEKSVNALKISSHEQRQLGIIDHIIAETPCMENNQELFAKEIGDYIVHNVRALTKDPIEEILSLRDKRYRSMGAFQECV